MPALLVGTLAVAPEAAYAAGEPSVPELVSPANGNGVNGGPAQLFTVRSTSQSVYWATIEIDGGTIPLARTFTTTVALSGQEATGMPPLSIEPGTWNWRARATAPYANASAGPVAATAEVLDSAWSAWQPFTVESPPTFGAGVVSGQVTFSYPLPGALRPCAITNFTFDGTLAPQTVPGTETDDANAGVYVNIQGHGYAGKIALSGSGTGACANATAGSGEVSVTGTGVDPNVGSLSCELDGYFVRLASYTTLSLGGDCVIGGTTTAPVNFRAEVLFRPDQGAGDGQFLGIDQSVRHAVFGGDFTVSPS